VVGMSAAVAAANTISSRRSQPDLPSAAASPPMMIGNDPAASGGSFIAAASGANSRPPRFGGERGEVRSVTDTYVPDLGAGERADRRRLLLIAQASRLVDPMERDPAQDGLPLGIDQGGGAFN
jgi:hypothetical protein